MGDPPSKLSFGVLCEGTTFTDWEARCIERLLDVDGVDISLLVVDARANDSDGRVSQLIDYGRRSGVRDAVNKAAWWSYTRVLGDTPPAKRSRDLSDRLGDVETRECRVKEKGFSEYFREADLEAIASHDLDFLLRFGFGIIRGGIHDVTRYGVWSFHHGDERVYRGGPPCFWELYNREPTAGAILQRLTDELDAGVVLKRGFFAANQGSYHANLNHVYYGTTEWPAQVAKDLMNGTAPYLEAEPTETDAPIYTAPSPDKIARWSLRQKYDSVAKLLRGKTQWNIGIIDQSIESVVHDDTPEVQWFSNLRPDGFFADPFPAEVDGNLVVFFEDYSYQRGRAKISYVSYPEGFEEGTVQTAHTEPFHMSYPYPFEYDGDTYITPEIHEANEVRLYRVEAPDKWQFERTLVEDIQGVDPTVVQYDGRWWLFVTTPPYENTKLRVWHAPEPTGPWTPHDSNPIKTDVRSARPGGTPFVSDGVLYRPGQRCAETYGERLVVNRVDEITPETYEEQPIAELVPPLDGRYPSGCHTLSTGGGITAVDGRSFIYNRRVVRSRANRVRSEVADFLGQ